MLDAENFTINNMGGGVYFSVNTGMHELFRTACDKFYQSEKMKDKFKKTAVKAESGATVEEKNEIPA